MTKNGIIPAALAAALQGDLENTVAAMTPGGIEAQEAAGQQQFVASESLPRECFGCKRKQLEQMGIIFGDDIDDLFVSVQLPEGWVKRATGHSMHSKLLDEKGRERASIFYKAAFYDRSAHISLTRRFHFGVEPVMGYDHPDYESSEWHCVVRDCEEVAWCSEESLPPQPSEDRQLRLLWYDQKDALAKQGKEWLEANYPEWQDPLAYWE